MLAVALAAGPLRAQTGSPGVDADRTAPAAERAETPIGTEAFADEPLVDLDQPRRAFGPAQITFRIATWHLGAKTAQAVEKEQGPAAAKPASTWRHTFGSERRTARWRELAEAGFAADIVALQGVTSANDARRLFPARAYHVVVSRQLLARSNARSTGIAVFRNDSPETTALTFRRQRGVRLAGFRHFLPDAVQTRNEREAAAISAFRLRVYGKLIWFASIDLGADCQEGAGRALCGDSASILDGFKDWATQLKGGRAPLVLLGRWPDATPAMLEAAGFGLSSVAADASARCAPQASGALLAMPSGSGAIKTEITRQSSAAGGNACAHLAQITMHLRDGD